MKFSDEIATIEEAAQAFLGESINLLQVSLYVSLGYVYSKINVDDEWYILCKSPSGKTIASPLYDSINAVDRGARHFVLCLTKVVLRQFDELSDYEEACSAKDDQDDAPGDEY